MTTPLFVCCTVAGSGSKATIPHHKNTCNKIIGCAVIACLIAGTNVDQNRAFWHLHQIFRIENCWAKPEHLNLTTHCIENSENEEIFVKYYSNQIFIFNNFI